MNPFQSVIEEIERGRSGDQLWIPFRYPSLSKHIGITKRLYHLIGGDPGSGKTAFLDQSYVLDAHEFADNSDKVNLKTLYFSMERSKVYKQTKWLAHRLYTHNSILRSINDLFGFGNAKYPVTDELLAVINSHEDYFNRLFQNVWIRDGGNNPTGIFKEVYNFALFNGIIYGRDENGGYYKTTLQSWNDRDKNKRNIPISKDDCPITLKNAYDRQYVPNDPKTILQIVIDHFGRTSSEQSLNKKQTIDKLSKYLSDMRDLFGLSIVGVSQFNRNNANIQRRINTDLTPEQQDFKDSGNTFEDSDVVLGLFNPHKHGLKSYKGFNISLTKDPAIGASRFRSLTLMKNSYGVDNLIAGFKFVGECGYYHQITGKPNEINYEEVFRT